MAKPAGKAPRVSKKPFPWLMLVILLATVYVFWVLPRQLGPRPISVDFEPAAPNKK